jgi:hypothetical protein
MACPGLPLWQIGRRLDDLNASNYIVVSQCFLYGLYDSLIAPAVQWVNFA